jgi:hypothetical protein
LGLKIGRDICFSSEDLSANVEEAAIFCVIG